MDPSPVMAQDPEEYEHVDAKSEDEKEDTTTSDTSSDASAAADADVDHDAEDAPSLVRRQARILDACRRRDIDDLQAIAISNGGFISDKIRSQACKWS